MIVISKIHLHFAAELIQRTIREQWQRKTKESQVSQKEEEESKEEKKQYHIILFYKYVHVDDPDYVKQWHQKFCASHNLLGRVLLAKEGINSTLSGSLSSIQSYQQALSILTLPNQPNVFVFSNIDFKPSIAYIEPFPDLKIKINPELISTAGKVPYIPSDSTTGVHLSPQDYHMKLTNKSSNTVIIDVRNKNEYEVGHFEGAINPKTRVFPEFLKFIDDNLPLLRGKEVLMYCTGGIRCEKASAYMKDRGIEEVYQLEGGIHRYLDQFPNGGEFKGKNYVFDRRILQESSECTQVIGKCASCSNPWEYFTGNRLCTVCRDPILVCDPCHDRYKGVFYCDDHTHLKGLYYYFIDGFTVDQLTAQRDGLQKIHEGLLHKKNKNKRRTIFKQMNLIGQRILELTNNNELLKQTGFIQRCRTCKESMCDGNCWGYYAANIRGKA